MKNVGPFQNEVISMKVMKLKNLIFLVFILCFKPSISKTTNSTECYNMYLNKTTNKNCVDNTTCCLYSYVTNNVTNYLCEIIPTEKNDICQRYHDILRFTIGVKNFTCECGFIFYDIKLYLILLSITLYLT